jgi:3-(3-hydroxy-phenyl)propionate hydroxylase
MPRYEYRPFPYVVPPEIGKTDIKKTPVLIVGAGPIGLSAAIDLALHGIPCTVCDENDVVSLGSRAICWSKRTLEIFDRLGVADRMVEKGVTWKVGRLFHRDKEVYSFDLLPEPGHKMPAFINLQQYYVEQYLVERCADFPDLIDLRWKNRVKELAHREGSASAVVETPDGQYVVKADYVLACDGAVSSIRKAMRLELQGSAFDERFLICDVEMEADFPSERWFWFEPPFHNGQTALLHKQPDNIYRIDLQLGWDADPEEEKRPERVIPRIKAMVGSRPFTIDWVSVYRFQCRRLDQFVHGRVIFVGDSAHVVSPFGARGGNGGIHDVDNLCWKLAAVLKHEAPERLIESYNEERVHGADENILQSARTTNFMSPKPGMERVFRDSVLELASDMPFARALVNSGRLSQPCSLFGLSLQTPSSFLDGLPPGSPCIDAPLDGGWLLNRLGGSFQLLAIGDAKVPDMPGLALLRAGGELAQSRYGNGATYLIRPDQHVAARFQDPSAEEIIAARDRALARTA